MPNAPNRIFAALLLFLMVLKFTLPFLLTHPAYQLQRDEYLYLDEANHLAWGFLEVPPAQAVQAWFTKLMGNSWFWVRFWPALFGALNMGIIGLLVKRLGGNLFALALAGTGFLASAYLRIHGLFQPNALEYLYWTVYFYLLVCYLKQPKDKYLYGLGIFVGLGLLNKYSIIFFLAGAFPVILLSAHRRMFWRPAFYGAMAIALLLIFPNLVWQWQHHIPFWQHMQELKKTQLDLVQPKDFLMDQLLMCFPAILIWLTGLVASLRADWARPYRLIGWIYLAVIGVFLVLHGKSYYTLGLYPVLLAFGGVAWERMSASGWRVYLKPVLLGLPLLLVAPMVPLLVPVLSPEATAQYCRKFEDTGILRWEDGKNHLLPQDYADMLGWADIAGLVRKAYASLPQQERSRTIIWCDNYGEAGAVNYYNIPLGYPRAHATGASYSLWCPAKVNASTVILVSDKAPTELIPHFKSVQIIGRINNSYAREKDTHVSILRQPDAFVLQRWNAEIATERRRFGLE